MSEHWTDTEALNAIARVMRTTITGTPQANQLLLEIVREYVENTGRVTVWDGRSA